MGEEMTWEKVVDDMLNRAAKFRLSGMEDKARTLEEGARAIFEANKYQIKDKIQAAKSALAALQERAAVLTDMLKSPPKPLPSNPVDITKLQNKSVMNPKYRLMIKLDPFLLMQVREWMMDYAAYRNGGDFHNEYKSQKQFIDTQWLQYYINGRSSYPINKDGYEKWKSNSYT